ncbi:MAG: hypothetical protein U0Q21_05475 [Dermatophilaceae bacterium]
MTTARTTFRRLAALGAASALGIAGFSAAPSDAATPGDLPMTAATCVKTWGSLPKTNPTMVVGPLTGLRAGQHACYDRLVVDLDGRAPGYRVRYVDQIIQMGSGAVVPVRGGARLQIDINAPAYDADGTLVYTPANPREAVDVSGYRTLRQVRWLGTFEGYSEFGVGVRARLPFRVFTLTDGSDSRLVIDIAHSWS